MFTLKIKNKPSVGWHVNDRKPALGNVGDVIWIQADGDELSMVRAMFKDLPIAKGNRCIWHGEMAEFVYRNL